MIFLLALSFLCLLSNIFFSFNCSSRVLGKLDAVEEMLVEKEIIRPLHTTFYLILTNILKCIHYYIYLLDEETEAKGDKITWLK